MSALRASLDKFFQITERKSTVTREIRGATATYLTMSYILFANPLILSRAGIPYTDAVAATALTAGLCSILMGLYANFPVALASGMGLNSLVAFSLAPKMGGWQAAMGLVVLNGLVVFSLVLLGVREAVLKAIPKSLRLAIGSGIGFFIALIGLVDAHIIRVPAGTVFELSKTPGLALPPVTFGNIRQPEVWVALLGLVFTAGLLARKVRGALLLGILATGSLAVFLGLSPWKVEWQAPQFSTLFQADIGAALHWKYVPFLLALVMVDFFDTLGTASGLALQAGLTDSKGQFPRIKRVLGVDALSASIGGLFGASSATSYIESAAGIAEGARTGLHTVLVGVLFLLSIPFAPLAAYVAPCATAPALILVGFLMMAQLADIDWADYQTSIPAFLTLIGIPLTYSIAHGIGLGFISFVMIQCLLGKPRNVSPLLWATAALFAAFFIWGH